MDLSCCKEVNSTGQYIQAHLSPSYITIRGLNALLTTEKRNINQSKEFGILGKFLFPQLFLNEVLLSSKEENYDI